MKEPPFHHQRPLVSCALFYGAGVAAGVYFVYRPLIALLGVLLCLAAALLLGRMGRRRTWGYMGAFLFLGILLGGRAAHPVLPPAGTYHITGMVAEDGVLRQDGSMQAYLEQAVAHTEEGDISLGTLYWTFTPDPEAVPVLQDGQRVAFTGRVYHPSGRSNPHGFDFRMFLMQQGVYAGVTGARDLVLLSRESRGVASFFYGIRKALSARMDLVFGEGSALPQALLLGEKSRLPQDVQDSFADAGVAHILSVSGLHVSLLAYLVMGLVPKRLGQRFRLVFLMVFLIFYCGLIGAPSSALRAGVFALMSRIRMLSRRNRDWVTVVAAAFLFILLFQPLEMFAAGFQLSFGAVCGIFTFLPKLERRLAPFSYTRMGENVSVSFAAHGGLLLPLAQWFHSFSIIGLVVNPPVCMLFTLFIPLYVLLLFLSCLWLPGAQTLAVPLHIITNGITALLEWAGDLPFAQIRMPYFPWYVVAALLLCFVLCTGLVALSRKKRVWMGICALVCSILCWRMTLCRQVQYVQLAMGQADAAIVTDGRETVVIDTGEYGGDVAEYLLCTGRRADTLVITHLHSDHVLGLQQLMQDHVPIGRVILPEGALEGEIDPLALEMLNELQQQGVALYFMHQGQYFETERCRFTALWPMAGTVLPGQDSNRYSLNLMMDLDGVTLLSASDMEGAYEMYAARDADILKVAHHGSKSSTGDAYLDALSPTAALITGGFSDTLPAQDTLSRLAKRGIWVYNTGETGAVTITCQEGKATLNTYLTPK